MVHMSGNYVAHWSSLLDPEKIYISPVPPDLIGKSRRDGIVNWSRRNGGVDGKAFMFRNEFHIHVSSIS